MTASDYRELLLQLLPPGLAYSKDQDSTHVSLVEAMAEELARLDSRAMEVVEESDPRTTDELFAEWLRVAGIPDDCSSLAATPEDERKQLLQKLSGIASQAPGSYQALAEALGYTARVQEFRMFVAGSSAGEPLYDEAWQNAFSVVIDQDSARAQAGIARAGDRLNVYAADFLYCLLQKAKPAQSIAFVGFE